MNSTYKPTTAEELNRRQQQAALTLDNIEDGLDKGLFNIPERLINDYILAVSQQRVLLNCQMTQEDNLGYVERWIETFATNNR